MALQPHFEEELVQMMRNNPFSLAIDGSNDNGVEKPVTVKAFDSQLGHVCTCTRFLDVFLTSGTGSAASIFSALNRALES